ncbi:cysteine proteinase [Fomitiporia mediterranea MF3/22]|uniref:cysteine proteinase n=1 Tax=Fomitiporia mediterranea (strain MF3/22) TaxID=694068 RepID=UPI0004409C83|nr:cysteine proteinase [Fomitiporia mediterranea MF3/22]EJD02420.1 cysteine proteinase [Fomitiporia mediterranea MF3/22]
MREKRKRIASNAKGLSAGERLNRNRLLAEYDLRWNWIGTEAKHVSDITREHCLRAAGISLSGLKRPCANKFIKDSRGCNPVQDLATSSEDPEDIIVISDGEEASTCDKKRCKDNPYCLNYMGQEKWEDEDKAKDAYLKAHLKGEDPHEHLKEAQPVGLKNLGATCYANAFLQVWFQDIAFRSGVYRCQPSPDNRIKFKDSPIFQLQVTFTALQEGIKSVFNPIKLVESLRLRTSEQQDAQEFSKLFMSHLDDEFKKQSDPDLRTLLSDQFEGKMVNATVCDKCKTRSERETTFLELEVNLEKGGTLMDRIASLLAPERLDENNKYMCAICDSLQDATRYTEIRGLPPVLHISLLRFVYDFATFERKKSKLPLRFPPYLDMKPFLNSAGPGQMVGEETSGTEIYELRGVLLHKGPSAYHGHYEAQVFNQETNQWYQFNDEAVTPLSSFYSPKSAPITSSEPIIVDGEDDTDRPAKRQKRNVNSRRIDDSDEGEAASTAPVAISTGTKVLSSKDAYMLIYARREEPNLDDARVPVPPTDALEIIRSSNEEHEKACADYNAMREQKKTEFIKVRDNIRDVYRSWHISSAYEPSVIVSKAALQKWILSPLAPLESKSSVQSATPAPSEQKPVEEVSEAAQNTETVASSNPDIANDTPWEALNIIDNTNLLCTHSIDQERLLNPLADKDMKIISMEARDKIVKDGTRLLPELTVDNVCRLCVENEFAEKLYQMEHPRLVAEFNEISSTATENEGFWISKTWFKDWVLNRPRMHVPSQPDPPPENVSDDPALGFRSHVYCKHGSLTINVGTRRRISLEAVKLLQRIFQDWEPPPWDAETCPACDVDVHISKESKLEQRKKAENEKAKFNRLNEENIFGQYGILQNSTFAVVPSEFIHSWRKWLVKPGDSPRVTEINTQSMLCPHERLILDLSEEADFDEDVAVLTMSEWEQLQTLYEAGPLIKCECRMELDGSGHERRYIISEIPCCSDCRTKEKLSFNSTMLTVIRIDKGLVPSNSTQLPSIVVQHPLAPSPVSNGKKLNEAKNSITAKANGTRQSRRLQEGKYSNCQQIRIQKDWTVKDVKAAIYKAFRIPTISQQLYYHGKELDDNSKTVAELQILNKDTLYLKEVIEDMIVLDSDIEDEPLRKKSRKHDEGDAFKGTLLSGGTKSPPPPPNGSDNPPGSRPSSPLQKACSACTLLNPLDAERCDACEAFL